MPTANPHTEVPITEEIFEKLNLLPYGARSLQSRRVFENAINRALDSVGWPAGDRGEIPIPTVYWYVNIWDKHGKLKGHVGPIHDGEKARQVAKSWRAVGYQCVRGFSALGAALTNNYLSS